MANDCNNNELEAYAALDPCAYQYWNSLFEARTVIFNGEINECFVEHVILPLLQFEHDSSIEGVHLVFGSPGGDVMTGLPLVNIIDNYSKPLEILFVPYVCSLGAVIACSGSKNPNVTKYCYPFTTALFHEGLICLEGPNGAARDTMEWSHKQDMQIRNYILSHTSIPAEEYDRKARNEWWMDSNEMMKYGIVDKIIGEPLPILDGNSQN